AAYQDYRLDQWKSNTMVGITSLEEQYKADATAIQAQQTNVDNLRAQLHIVDTDPNSYMPSPILATADMQKYNDEKLQDEKSFTDLKTTLEFLESVQATNKEALRDILPRMMPGGDSALSDSLQKWHTAKQTYVSLTNDYGPSSPEVIRAQ